MACRSSSSSLFLNNLNGGLGGGGSGLTTDSLGNNGLHINADLLGKTPGDGVGDVLDDGDRGSAVLGGDRGDGGVSEVAESVVSDQDLGVGLGLPLAVVSVGESRDDGLDVRADRRLVAGHGLANNHVGGGAVGLGVALLANNNFLMDNLTDGRSNDVGGVAKVSVAETVVSAQQELGVGLSLSGGGGEGGRGQEGQLEGDLGREGVKNGLRDPFTEL